MISKNIYFLLSKIYSKFFSITEKILLRNKNVNFEKPLIKFKNISKNAINYDEFEKIYQNKYLTKYIFPENKIVNTVKELFIKNRLSEKISNITGFNYSISFFTAYETKRISDQDFENEWYANQYHTDKPFSENMVKIFFSYEKIDEDNGPMLIKSDQIFKATILEDEVILFAPNKFFHRASSPKNGKRFQMMFQLNPSKKWNLNNNIFQKQKKIEPKFPFFSYFFDNKTDLKNL